MKNKRLTVIHEYGTLVPEGRSANISGEQFLPKKSFDNLWNFILENKANDNVDQVMSIHSKYGRKYIKASKYVGTIQTEDGHIIEILPKIYKSSSQEEENEQVAAGSREDGAELRTDGDFLTLSFQNGDVFRFRHERWTGWDGSEEMWRLIEAQAGELNVRVAERYAEEKFPDRVFYCMEDASGSVECYGEYDLENFNQKLFPRSTDEVRRAKRIRNAFTENGEIYSWRSMKNIGKGTLPVYSAPDESAWRAANGKAAVGLKGEIWPLDLVIGPEDGKLYSLIRYEVSPRTSRIGYVKNALGGKMTGENEPGPMREVKAVRDTFLTDDPDVSQFEQLAVPAGMTLRCYGIYGNDYAYVMGRTQGGVLAEMGQRVGGFVPMVDLELAEGEELPEDRAQFAGAWRYDAGGSMASEYLVFSADGSFEGYNRTEDGGGIEHPLFGRVRPAGAGEWKLIRYEPEWHQYWNNPPYELLLMDGETVINARGMIRDDAEHFSLTNFEGSGGYERVTE